MYMYVYRAFCYGRGGGGRDKYMYIYCERTRREGKTGPTKYYNGLQWTTMDNTMDYNGLQWTSKRTDRTPI